MIYDATLFGLFTRGGLTGQIPAHAPSRVLPTFIHANLYYFKEKHLHTKNN
jgi:hypothetical protein